jgi:hypothetical protein
MEARNKGDRNKRQNTTVWLVIVVVVVVAVVVEGRGGRGCKPVTPKTPQQLPEAIADNVLHFWTSAVLA